jgi:hypothetical protein
MLSKIFVLFVLGLSPEGQTLIAHQGQYNTEAACVLAAKDLQVRMHVAKVPKERAAVVCFQTPWPVPGERGA